MDSLFGYGVCLLLGCAVGCAFALDFFPLLECVCLLFYVADSVLCVIALIIIRLGLSLIGDWVVY